MNKVVLASLASAMLYGSTARAQDVALPEPVQQQNAPASAGEGEAEVVLDAERDIDLANVVTSAAKGVTTVQEAPAIITIITAEEIKQRGFKWLLDAVETVPGWQQQNSIGNQVQLPLVRGVIQSALLLHNGVSMFDPWGNIQDFSRHQPMEIVKRLEIVTGPGGVLWGANSFLGIVNVITKDAEDVNGLEISAGYGDGPGNRQDFKAYALFGKSLLNGKLKIFAHASYEDYIGQVSTQPLILAASPAPQPAGPLYWGTLTNLQPERSWVVTLDGHVTLWNKLSLYWYIPIVGQVHPQFTFGNAIVPADLFNDWDRYAFVEYKDRYLKDKLGLQAKAYYTQFNREFGITLFPPSSLFMPFVEPGGQSNLGGLHFDVGKHLIQRAGGTVDFDANLPYNIRILFGGEAFWESISDSTVTFNGVSDPAKLPLYCPEVMNADGTFTLVPKCPRQLIDDASRVVAAAYLDLQWKPIPKLTLDGGARYQQGFGQRGYAATFLGSAAVVWNFLPDYHLKANYATGFRPPVFQATDASLGGLEYGANPDLKTETSQSFQGELNARLLRNTRKIRELEVRLDYSYTFLDRLIQIPGGLYVNQGQRSIHSVEAYGKLYLQGDHFLTASYTFLHSEASDSGQVRSQPNHWVSLGGSFNVIKNTLDFNANLLVTGAYQDPNRYAGVAGNPVGACTNPAGYTNAGAPCSYSSAGTSTGRTTDLTFDRLTPVAQLQLGFRLRFFHEKLAISGQFYNVLNQRFWYVDTFYDLTPSIEYTPTPAPGFSFFANVSYHL